MPPRKKKVEDLPVEVPPGCRVASEEEMESIRRGDRRKMTPEEIAKETRMYAKKEEVPLPSMEDTVTVFGVGDDSQSDVSKAIKTLIGTDLRTSTEVTLDEVQDLTVLLEIAEKYHCSRIDSFCKHYMALKVSLNRGSRREVVQAFSGLEGMSHRSASQDIMSRLRGGGY